MNLVEIFGESGALARKKPGYSPRKAQVEMAREVTSAMDADGIAVLEAPPGVGKTFAYLVPILLTAVRDDRKDERRRTAIISTSTHALQTQLYEKDIPFLSNALGLSVNTAVLKGRAQYLCRDRFSRAQENLRIYMSRGRLPPRRKHAAAVMAEAKITGYVEPLRQFASYTQDGDISAVDAVPQNAAVWEYVTSTNENCRGKECDYYNDEECYVYMARARAKCADIVIVNHHLFLADLQLRKEGIAGILPECRVLVFDEAHLLPRTAMDAFKQRFSFKQLERRAGEVEGIATENDIASTGASLATAAAALRKSAINCNSSAVYSFSSEESNSPTDCFSYRKVMRDVHYRQAIKDCEEKLNVYRTQCEKAAEHFPQLEKYWNRACQDSSLMRAWCADGEKQGEDAAQRDESDISICWLERDKNKKDASLCWSPLSARHIFSKSVLDEGHACIFTSATLTAGGRFDYFCGEMGLDDARQITWDSPYDMAGRTKIYIPQNMPDARKDEFAATAADEALRLVAAAGGRAFVLCTSFTIMNVMANKLRDGMPKHIPVLVQKDAPSKELLRRFQERPSVLVGSETFRQGVDIPGNALSMVIVDKLPFRPLRSDPVLQAREEWCKIHGIDAFMRDQAPYAETGLRQAAGRLIRGSSDYGVFVVLDLRLINKNYGPTIMRSLSPMPLTRSAEEVITFLKKMRAAAGAK